MPGTQKKIAGLITHYFGGNRTPKLRNSDFQTTSKQGLKPLKLEESIFRNVDITWPVVPCNIDISCTVPSYRNHVESILHD